jgi:hypothetical protein
VLKSNVLVVKMFWEPVMAKKARNVALKVSEARDCGLVAIASRAINRPPTASAPR